MKKAAHPDGFFHFIRCIFDFYVLRTLISRIHILFDQPVKLPHYTGRSDHMPLSINASVQAFSRLFDPIYQFFPALHISLLLSLGERFSPVVDQYHKRYRRQHNR